MDKFIIDKIFGDAESCFVNKQNNALFEVNSLAERIMLVISEHVCLLSCLTEVEHSNFYDTNAVTFNCKIKLLYELCNRIREIMIEFSKEIISLAAFSNEKNSLRTSESDLIEVKITHIGADIYFHFGSLNDKKKITIFNHCNDNEGYTHSEVRIEYPC